MPINAGYEYSVAVGEYDKAKTPKEKLIALQKVLAASPNHKGTERLRSGIKQKIAKLREQIETQSKKKGGGSSISIKKEGAAQVCLIGTTSSGKTTFLNKVTKLNAEIGTHPFTTTKPEVGTMDYKGIKIQIVEIPAITKDYMAQDRGPMFLGIIKQTNLLVIFSRNREEMNLVLKELRDNEVNTPHIIFFDDLDMVEIIWRNLGLVKVFTKQPGKEKDLPPIAFKKGATVKNLADILHKDFVKKFKFARIWGKGAKFNGQSVGLNYELKDDNIVELHVK